MLVTRFVPTCLALWLLACGSSPGESPSAPADLVFFGEHILTVDPSNPDARGVAVRGNDIVAVGSREEVRAYVGANTRVVELEERALTPGFIDAHGHLALVMRTLDLVNLAPPPVGPVERIDDIVTALEERISERDVPAGEWLFGFGYDDSLLAERRHPTRDDLDRVSTRYPVGLMHISGHLVALNSAALAEVGLTSESPDPAGGVIRRRAGTREPNGVLEETAALAVLATVMGQGAAEAFPAELQRALAYHASYGITTVQDGASAVEFVGGLRAIATHAPLPLDVAAFVHVNAMPLDAPIEAIGHSREYENGVRVAGVKFTLDGSPQGRTAWLTEPYIEGPPGAPADYVAYPSIDPAHYKAQVARMLRAGIPVLAHANGDAAIDLMIEGVAEALGDERPDHRSVTIHAQLTREDQLDAMQQLGIVPSFFAAHPFFWGDWHRLSFGDARASRISPLRSTIDRGMPYTIHNDAPVVPPDVMQLLEIAVTRTTRSGSVLGSQQRASVEEALYGVTLGAAYAYFEEGRKGSISPGKQADLVVLARDPREVAADEIGEIDVLETFARGHSVFARDAEAASPAAR
ncbi:MAG: amidohydrolase [Deltaproteobacteria bacterium]|nr:amidohydrolase [Deltaproteobacteria bacterium]